MIKFMAWQWVLHWDLSQPNYFWNIHEKRSGQRSLKLVKYFYIDGMLMSSCLFACEKDADEFFNFLNSCHPNRKSTFEKKKDIKIAFSDIRINKINQLLHKCVSEKYVNSFIYQFFEFNPFSYKIGLIKTLIHRTYAISCSWNLFHDEIENTKHLQENYMYPPCLIDKQIKLFLNDKP